MEHDFLHLQHDPDLFGGPFAKLGHFCLSLKGEGSVMSFGKGLELRV